MSDKHPLQDLANDYQFFEALQDAMRLGIRFNEMITTLQAITGQSREDAQRDLENAMGTLIHRKMMGK